MTYPFRNGRVLVVLGMLPLGACAITPEPFAESDLKQQGAMRMQRAAEIRTPVNGTLTLQDAVARAIRYNLDHRVEMYEAALRQAELGVSTAAMLPNLVAGAISTGRDNQLASSSYNVVTQTQNFGASTSQDRGLETADLTLSWNILDFGLSYVRARQAADKVLIAQENRRRVVHKLVEDVRTAFWRAYAAEKLTDRLKHVEARTNVALSRSQRQANEGDTSPVNALTYRREMIEIQRVVRELQRELATARIQLSSLINEKPGATYRLAAPRPLPLGKDLGQHPDALIEIALQKRPELREISYRRRINAQEAHASLLELLPGIQLFAGTNLDSNSFLLNDQWALWGAKASWNLIRLFQYPHRRDVIEAQDVVLEQRDQAMTLTVLTQIYASRARMAVIEREVDTSKKYTETQSALLKHIRAEHAVNRISEQTLLREELNDLVGEVRNSLAHANLQSARAALAAAVGVDPPGYDEVQAASSAERPDAHSRLWRVAVKAE